MQGNLCEVCRINPAETVDHRADQAGAVGRIASCRPCMGLKKEIWEKVNCASSVDEKKAVLATAYPGGDWEKHTPAVREKYMRRCPDCGREFLNTLDWHNVPCPSCGKWVGFVVPRALGEPNFQEMEVFSQDEKIRVVLTWLGEGIDGDYNPEDAEDVPLLRFDVYTWSEEDSAWSCPEDSSYCTQLSAFAGEEICRKAIEHILCEVENRGGNSMKRVCEELSWISEMEFLPNPTPKDEEEDDLA